MTLRYAQQGYFDTPQWSWAWKTLTVVVGNPEAVSRGVRCGADCGERATLSAAVTCPATSSTVRASGVCATRRFVGANLNRLFASQPTPASEDGPAESPGLPSEHRRAAVLARAIQGATAYLDLHSTSAETPPFAFQQPGCAVAARFAASFPVAYTIDDRTIIGKVRPHM